MENETVFNERGRGLGLGRGKGGPGMGFAFRGSSPAWPYVGRGRGGRPRCAYYAGGTNAPADVAAAGETREQELQELHRQSEALTGQLEQLKDRIEDLKGETQSPDVETN